MKPNTFNPIKDRKSQLIRRKHGSIRQKNGKTKKQSNIGKIYTNTNVQRFNIWEINTEVSNINRYHPAQFPEKLVGDHIISWSNENDVILDPFIGSGTTAKVCEKLNRKWIGIEFSEEYCKIAKHRIEIERNQLKVDFF